MKHIITPIIFVLSLCAASDTQAATYQPTVSKSTIIICRDTTIWRAKPLTLASNSHGRQFLICKGIKVRYNDTLNGFHNDTFLLMEYAELTFDSTPSLGASRQVSAAPWSKIFLSKSNPAIYCDSTVYVSRYSFQVYQEDWDTLAGGEYFDFSLWPGKMNPCCVPNTGSIRNSVAGVFEVYPNPATAVVHLRSETAITKPIHLVFMDIHGKRISESTWHSGQSYNLATGVRPGIYLLVAKTESGMCTTRILVE